jgi:L-aminopeptidase/D-esterase-like protein
MFGMKYAMKGGLGTSSIRVGRTGIVVGAIVAVNALGDCINPRTGKIIAGARRPDGRGFSNQMDRIRAGEGVLARSNTNTTIGVVATNASFDKTEMSKIAQMASAGLARAINPVYTTYDGDAIFAISTGTSPVKASHGAIGALAAEALSDAIVRAVVKAESLTGLPCYRDLTGK